MNLMVNPTITGFRQEVDGTIKELKLGEAKEDAYANIIEQGGADLDNNKTATINVSTYTDPVEVKPSSGKDGMKKATITLSNIPSPTGSATAYGWVDTENEVVQYTNFSVAPETLTNELLLDLGSDYPGVETLDLPGQTYTKISDTSYSINGERFTYTFTRDTTIDFTLWQASS